MASSKKVLLFLNSFLFAPVDPLLTGLIAIHNYIFQLVFILYLTKLRVCQTLKLSLEWHKIAARERRKGLTNICFVEEGRVGGLVLLCDMTTVEILFVRMYVIKEDPSSCKGKHLVYIILHVGPTFFAMWLSKYLVSNQWFVQTG